MCVAAQLCSGASHSSCCRLLLTCLDLQDGKQVLTGWSDGKIRVFGPESGKELYSIHDAHHGEVRRTHSCTAQGAAYCLEQAASGQLTRCRLANIPS